MRLYSGYVFDLDGTLYRGEDPIPGAVEVVSELKARGAQICYLTNNSSQTRRFFADKLAAMGFPVELEEIASSGLGTGIVLRDSGIGTAFVVGEPGLVETLREVDIEVVNASEDGSARPESVDAESVVVGIHRSFSYQMMDCAMQCLLKGAKFYATNRDSTFPMEAGRLYPGAGSIVASIATCSGREPYVIGKPNPLLIELVLKHMGMAAPDLLVVGDRDDTDLESGRRAGCDTHLVLTGIETEAKPGQAFSPDLRGLL